MTIIDLVIQYLLALSMKLLGYFSPQKARAGRRAMFLISIYTALVKEGLLQEMSLESFNDSFHLANDADSLEAAKYAAVFWSKVDLKSELKECIKVEDTLDSKEGRLRTLQLFCPKVVNQSPKWMRYGNFEMTEELSDVLLLSGFRKEVKENIPT